MCKNNVFYRKLANTRPTKDLYAFFTFAESLPTSATLPIALSMIWIFPKNSIKQQSHHQSHSYHDIIIMIIRNVLRYQFKRTDANPCSKKLLQTWKAGWHEIIPDICQFWETTSLFNTPKGAKICHKIAKTGQNFGLSVQKKRRRLKKVHHCRLWQLWQKSAMEKLT